MAFIESNDHRNEHDDPNATPEPNHQDKFDDECVCNIVKKIHKAQAAAEESSCKVSCEKSIHQMLSSKKESANTIPFSLDCGCETFIGKAPVYDHNDNFCIISSPFFKVKKVKHNCCAILELLWPTCDGEVFKGTFPHDGRKVFPSFKFDGFIGTGSCITVDLKCFCSITCHKPTKVKDATRCQIHDIFKCHRD